MPQGRSSPPHHANLPAAVARPCLPERLMLARNPEAVTGTRRAAHPGGLPDPARERPEVLGLAVREDPSARIEHRVAVADTAGLAVDAEPERVAVVEWAARGRRLGMVDAGKIAAQAAHALEAPV
jgi:hypothetical protein